MPKREAPQPSPKLLALLKEFQQVAGMAGFLNHSIDPPQLRMQFTLYGRVRVADEAEAEARRPALEAWCAALSEKLREESSGTILPPQLNIAPPQAFPGGGFLLVATLSFATKVTDASYFRVKTAVTAAYQEAVRLREQGLDGRSPAPLPAEPQPAE